MFWHNFKYQFKILLHERGLIFWTLAFPLIMATMFHFAFSNIEASESLGIIPIAVVDDSAWQSSPAFRETFAELSQNGSANQLFEITYLSDMEAAEQLLRDETVSGVLRLGPDPEITALKSNIDVTILKSVVDQVFEQSQVMQDIAARNPALLAELAASEHSHLEDASREKLSYTLIEFYSLIAMTCLYGGMIGMVAVNYLLANMSASGKRIAVSPASKGCLLTSGLLASYVIQLFGLMLLFAFTIFVLHIDYGNHVSLVILLAFVGSLSGLALGAMIASVFHFSENAKVGLMLAVSMFGCFLAGMMGITMKYLVDTNLPLLNQINPANLITDGLYALYYYPTLDRFWGDIIALVIITLVIICISVFSLRKEQYDNL